MGNILTQGSYAFLLRFAPNLQAIESCDVIKNFPFPLTQRLKISGDITKENEIYFDSKEFIFLLRVWFKNAEIFPHRIHVTLLMHRGDTLPNQMQTC